MAWKPLPGKGFRRYRPHPACGAERARAEAAMGPWRADAGEQPLVGRAAFGDHGGIEYGPVQARPPPRPPPQEVDAGPDRFGGPGPVSPWMSAAYRAAQASTGTPEPSVAAG
ncbi:hypothetical protein GCM10009602_53730 [Nocardiopsis tropica]